MKEKMYFLAPWLADRAKTWSGTVNGIFEALSSHYEMEDINLSEIKESPFLKVIKRLTGSSRDMGIGNYSKYAKTLANRGINDGVVFQFAEIMYDTDGLKTYIYQDLSVDYVCYMHDNLPEIFKVSAFQEVDINQAYKRRRLQNEYFSKCAGIFAMGHWYAEDLIKRVGIPANKVYAVGGGINVDLHLISSTKKLGNKILFIGRDFKRKGGHITVEAFKLLREQNPQIELYVAGPQEDPFKGEIIEGYHFMGDCNRNKIAELYNMCNVFCMPSYFEAYGLVFIEALTYGLPCIGRNCYEMPYFIEDGKTGYLLKKDDAEELAELMNKLLTDERILNNVKSRKEFYIKEYSWDSVALRMKKIIKNI